MLGPVVREGLGIMAGLFWDLGERDVPHAAIMNQAGNTR
jgi:hypothetical protein